MPARLAILLSISRISLLAMFLRMPSISSSCMNEALSFFSLCRCCGLSGADGVSSIILRPRETLLLCLLPSSDRSGKLAWKPWNNE